MHFRGVEKRGHKIAWGVILFLMIRFCLTVLFSWMIFFPPKIFAEELSVAPSAAPEGIALSAESNIFEEFLKRITVSTVREDLSGYNRGNLPYGVLEENETLTVKSSAQNNRNNGEVAGLAFEHGVAEAVKTPETVTHVSNSRTDMFGGLLDALLSVFNLGNTYAKGMKDSALPRGVEIKADGKSSEMEEAWPLSKCTDLPRGVNAGCDEKSLFSE